MKLSARNQLAGTVQSITTGEAMAVVKVRLNGDGQFVSAAVTRESVADLGLTAGSAVTVLVKSTEVMLGV